MVSPRQDYNSSRELSLGHSNEWLFLRQLWSLSSTQILQLYTQLVIWLISTKHTAELAGVPAVVHREDTTATPQHWPRLGQSQRCHADNLSLTVLKAHILSKAALNLEISPHISTVGHGMQSQHSSWTTHFKTHKSRNTTAAVLPWPSSWAHCEPAGPAGLKFPNCDPQTSSK